MTKKEIKLDAKREITLLSSTLHQEVRKLIHQAREHGVDLSW